MATTATVISKKGGAVTTVTVGERQAFLPSSHAVAKLLPPLAGEGAKQRPPPHAEEGVLQQRAGRPAQGNPIFLAARHRRARRRDRMSVISGLCL